MSAGPILFQWTGDAMEPARRSHNICNATFVVGQFYRLEEILDRFAKSHNHYFADLSESWKNLPEDMAERFPTSEHLRKFALIKCGFADQRQIVCSSKAEAQRIAAFVKPMDEYAIVTVRDAVVTVWTAHSQSMRAMGKKVFQESKTAVLEYVAGLIGVSRDDLRENAGMAA